MNPYMKGFPDINVTVVTSADGSSEFGVRGIPNSSIIGPDGIVAWRGHPSNAGLDTTIKELLEKYPNIGSKSKGGPEEMYKQAKKLLRNKITMYDGYLLLKEVVQNYGDHEKIGEPATKYLEKKESSEKTMEKINAAKKYTDARLEMERAEAAAEKGEWDTVEEICDTVLDAVPGTRYATAAKKLLRKVPKK